MSFFPKRTLSSILLIFSLAIILCVLAVLQYRWSDQVSEATHDRLHSSLRLSMDQFRIQYANEIQQLRFQLQPDTVVLMRKDWKSYAENCSSVLRSSGVHLVRSVYLWLAKDAGNSELLRLNRQSEEFEFASWPANLEYVRDRYLNSFSDPQWNGPGMRPRSGITLSDIPMLLEPVFTFQRPDGLPGRPGTKEPFLGYLMIELSLESIRNELFPNLARKSFQDPEGFRYWVAVVDRAHGDSIIYRSDSNFGPADIAHPDASIRLGDNPWERFRPEGPARGMEPPAQRLPPPGGPPPGMQNRAPNPMRMEDGNWELVAKHPEGSLEAAIAGLRRRNLAISFGGLILLALSMALIVSSARNAQRLARLQLDFVAGISHELRTPLAVICSAGDNLAEGIVPDASSSSKKYGELIREEGRKLTGMVEQILQFASLRRGRHQYTLVPVRINEIAAKALEQEQPRIAAAGCSVEKSFAPDLPAVNADAAALSQAIQNLIQNALKYSGKGRWLGLRTERIQKRHGTEVRLTVEDRGIGIESSDLPHVFEPFYRGGAAIAAQIHGTGLGLFAVREALAAMGASIRVKSSPGKGSTFTIHFLGR
jgi:two-component system, OmpR family, sensor histidine kinase SenX3